MELSTLQNSIQDRVDDVPVRIGYPATGDRAPYIVIRPLYIDAEVTTLAGSALYWANQITAYAVGASVEASFNLAKAMLAMQGHTVGGYVVSTTLGYVGAQVEGQYETQVTISHEQGEL